MEKLLDKIDQYLFDIVGILLPGAFGLLAFIFLAGLNLKRFKELTPDFFPNLHIVIFVIGCFLFGHTIKHCSVTLYRFLTAWLDEGFYKLKWQKVFNMEHKWIKGPKEFILIKWPKLYEFLGFLYQCIFKFFEPIWAVLYNDILKFSTSPYSKKKYGQIESFVINKLKQDSEFLTITDSLTDNKMMRDEIYKISTIISHNENIKSLGNVHLAKYNCYRSLVFIFFAIIVYCSLVIIINPNSFRNPNFFDTGYSKYFWSLLIASIMFCTFHYKFKRYWNLCSTEALTALFYYFYKKDKNVLGSS